jgi:hypothetical protein
MGAIWKFFSGEDDTPPAPEQSAQRTSLWGLFTGQHTLEPVDERTAAAYHEAGHARAIRVGGEPVKSMEVHDDGHGATKPDRDPYWTWGLRRTTEEQNRRADLVTYVAGQESECQYLMDRHGYSYKEALHATDPGASDDKKEFKERAKGTGYTFEGMRDEARRLVRRHAYTIETNAKALDRDGRRGGTWA